MNEVAGVKKEDLDFIFSVIRKNLHGSKFHVFVFGSRVTGNARPDSDLDILIEGETRISDTKRAFIMEELENSNLTCKVDIVDSHDIHPEYKNGIYSTRQAVF
ncbi:MAG: nucleotidyltransferase domain-containing protein [Candidatus Aureabacteria bacterium]|nr:nucleotidyltransferase domain-containing protein [Candidatus Auribacterota bacterium]